MIHQFLSLSLQVLYYIVELIIFISIILAINTKNRIRQSITYAIIFSLLSSLLSAMLGFFIGKITLNAKYLEHLSIYLDKITNNKTFQPNSIVFVIVSAIFLGLIAKSLELNIIRHLDALNKKLFILLQIFLPIIIVLNFINIILSHDFRIINDLLLIVLSFLFAYVVQYIGIVCAANWFGKQKPFYFIQRTKQTFLKTLIIGSSKFLIPNASRDLEEHFKVSSVNAHVVLPIIALISTSGLATYLGMVSGIGSTLGSYTISFTVLFIIFFKIIICSVGCGGIQNGAIVVLPIILNAINLNSEFISIFIMIDFVINPIRSAINILNDILIILISNLHDKK